MTSLLQYLAKNMALLVQFFVKIVNRVYFHSICKLYRLLTSRAAGGAVYDPETPAHDLAVPAVQVADGVAGEPSVP